MDVLLWEQNKVDTSFCCGTMVVKGNVLSSDNRIVLRNFVFVKGFWKGIYAEQENARTNV